MKFNLRTLATIGITFSAFSCPVFAGGEGIIDGEKSGIYFSGGVGTTSVDDIKGTITSSITNKTELEKGFLYSAGFGYDFGDFRAEVNYRKDSFDINKYSVTNNGTTTAATSAKGDFDASTIGVNIFYDFNNSSKFTPYIGAGIGSTKIDTKNTVIEGTPVANADDSKTSYNLKLGISYEVAKSSELYLEGTYLSISDVELSDAKIDDIKNYSVLAGLRFSL
tara:strand:+ start:163 stop:828 length:666 start_codon:yes stop_codon:yes gene_type:complete